MPARIIRLTIEYSVCIILFKALVIKRLSLCFSLRGGLMVSALDSGSGGPGSSPGRPGHCVVFLGKILYSHSASLHPGV